MIVNYLSFLYISFIWVTCASIMISCRYLFCEDNKHLKVHLLTWHSVCDSVYPVLPGTVGCHHGVGERHELVGRAEAQAGVVSLQFWCHQQLQSAPARACSVRDIFGNNQLGNINLFRKIAIPN